MSAPAHLRAQVEARLRAARPVHRRLRLTLVGALAAAVAGAGLVAALALPGDVPGGPTIVQAAELSLRPPTGPPPGQSSERPGLLRKQAGGVAYPYWGDRFGWQATGTRTDRLGEREVSTVFYQRGAQQIGYSIVDGERLPPPVATTDQVIDGVRLRSFLADGRQVVTWVRDGRTCILSGGGVDVEVLFALAGWRGTGRDRL